MPNAHGVGVYLCNPRPPMCRPPDCERKRKRLLGSQRYPSIGLKVLFICQELIKFERRTLDSKTRSIGYDIPDGESGESIKDFPFFCFPIPGINPAPAKRLILWSLSKILETTLKNISQQHRTLLIWIT